MNKIQIEDREFEILIENDNICKRTRLIGIQINLDYENRCPLFIGVLNGSFMFMGDLLKEITVSCEVAFIKVSSYSGAKSSGKVKEIFGLPEDIHNRDTHRLLFFKLYCSGWPFYVVPEVRTPVTQRMLLVTADFDVE